ncbi:MAG: class I SAM-dependent methyltransferase [Sphingobacteriaceae bacterium]|nr:class I SAM-dependent methyltransferase [Sphingobacteriaceae bacterium]
MKDVLSLAKENLKDIKNVDFSESSIYELNYESNTFDYVFCWQTLLSLDKPENAIHELLRVCKPGGKVFVSSLFNIHFDVDIYTQYIDHTLPSSKENISLPCNTISHFTLNKWLNQRAAKFELHEFIPKVDFKK